MLGSATNAKFGMTHVSHLTSSHDYLGALVAVGVGGAGDALAAVGAHPVALDLALGAEGVVAPRDGAVATPAAHDGLPVEGVVSLRVALLHQVLHPGQVGEHF